MIFKNICQIVVAFSEYMKFNRYLALFFSMLNRDKNTLRDLRAYIIIQITIILKQECKLVHIRIWTSSPAVISSAVVLMCLMRRIQLVRAECVRCPWLQAEMKLATIFITFLLEYNLTEPEYLVRVECVRCPWLLA